VSQLLEPTPLSAPFQESEVIDKIDNDGHHYLKVLLLSNKKTRNNWIAPYKRIGDLPKELIDSFIGLPRISEHDYQYFDKLQAQLFNKGKSDEEILAILTEESRKKAPDYIDHVFTDDPNSSLLYGQLKVMDPVENEYISKYGKPSKNYTSPAMYGVYKVHDDGTMVYDVNTMRPFHVAGVDVPAFPEQEAKVKGVCAGSSDSCKKALAYAGFDSGTTVTTSSSSSSTPVPTENVNNTCSCNKNIQDMSTNTQSQPAVTTVSTTAATAAETPKTTAVEGNLLRDSQNTTAEAIKAAREEAQRIIKEASSTDPKQKQPKQEEEQNQEDEEEKSLKLELRKYKQIAEEERKRNLDQYNFILDEVLSVHIPRAHFKKEEDFNTEKESMKSFINKYNVNLQDAKWLITKAVKGIPNQNEEQQTSNKKEGGKHGVGVAGLLSTTYNPDYITKPEQQSIPRPAGDSNSHLEDDDFPLGIE